MLQFVVNGLVADGNLVFELAIGRMDGRLLSENDSAHQLHKGGEEQFVGVLPLRGPREQLIKGLRIEETLKGCSGHDANGCFLDEGFKDLVE